MEMHTIDKQSENGVAQENSLSLINPAQQVTTLATIVNDEYPLSIIRARHEQGDEPLVKYIMDKINDYLDMVDLRSSMNPKQVLLASQLIVEKHPHLPIKALDVFFKDAVCGEFGHHYNRMDIPTLMQWLHKFENNYFDMVEEQAYAEHMSTKGDKGIDLVALAKSREQAEEVVAMPDSLKKKMHIKREETLADKIRAQVIKENSHLFSTLSFEDAQKQITSIINDELIKQGIFNLD
jgi:hypothetical protein